MSFIIKQEINKNIYPDSYIRKYVFPTGDIYTELKRSSGSNNYALINTDFGNNKPFHEFYGNNNDDYVYTTSDSYQTDLYSLSIPTSDIVSVRSVNVHYRMNYTPTNPSDDCNWGLSLSGATTSIYWHNHYWDNEWARTIVWTDYGAGMPDAHSPADFDIPNAFWQKRCTRYWNTNPSTGSSWTISDLSNISIGFRGKRVITDSDSNRIDYIYPESDLSVELYGTGDNYARVDEPYNSPNDSDNVYNWYKWAGSHNNTSYNGIWFGLWHPVSGIDLSSLYSAQADSAWTTDSEVFPGYSIDDLNNLSLMVRVYSYSVGNYRTDVYGISIATSYSSSDKLWGSSYGTSPITPYMTNLVQLRVFGRWRSEDIYFGGDTYCYGKCSQLYLQMTSDFDYSPPFMLLNYYLSVDYYPSSTCTLSTPEKVSSNHTRNIKMLNFWNGSREVYDYNRSGKSLVLKGKEYENSGCNTISCIKSMAENGLPITLSGLSFTPWNRDYKIRSFGWKRISKKPDTWEWILELEEENIEEEC